MPQANFQIERNTSSKVLIENVNNKSSSIGGEVRKEILPRQYDSSIVFFRKNRRRLPEIARNLEPSLSCCQIQPGVGSLSRYTYTTVFTIKTSRCTKILSIVLKCAQNARNYLSNERICMNIRKFSLGVHTEIYGVFKV